jgi:tetratricopeptide (TPR) repeat protein
MSSLINLNSDNVLIGSVHEHASNNSHKAVKGEKRKFRRFKCEVPIIYKYYDAEIFLDEFKTVEGTAYNYSLNGMYFKTRNPLDPDSPVYIKIKDFSRYSSALEAHEGHHAEVKWCRKKNCEANFSYSIGAQFYEALAHSDDFQGKYSEAEPLLKRSLVIREKVLGPDHPDVAISLNNLANLYSDQGKYSEAEPLLKRSLAKREKAFGPKHPDVAAVLENMAACCKKLGKKNEANNFKDKAQKIRSNL